MRVVDTSTFNISICTISSLISNKTFDRVWHAALWATMRKYNISANLVRIIGQLHDKATSAVQMNGSTGEWFRTTVGVKQGCLLSPTLFNIFLERIMFDALEEHDGKVSIGSRNMTNLRFADDIDTLVVIVLSDEPMQNYGRGLVHRKLVKALR